MDIGLGEGRAGGEVGGVEESPSQNEATAGHVFREMLKRNIQQKHWNWEET